MSSGLARLVKVGQKLILSWLNSEKKLKVLTLISKRKIKLSQSTVLGSYF